MTAITHSKPAPCISANKFPTSIVSACLRSLVIVAWVALGLSPFAYSSITIQSYWPLGEAAAIGTDTSNANDGTLNPFNSLAGSTILTASPSSAAGSTAYSHTSGTNYQGIWMFGAGSTAQTVPADNWGVQFNVRVTTLPTSGYRAVFGMAEGVSQGLVIEAAYVSGTVYFDVNKQGVANYIIPRNALATVTANTWYNLALVKSGGTTYFYINGALAGSNAGAINTSGLIALGFNQNIGTSHLTGDYDEARFFTFAAGAFATSDLSMTKRTVTYAGNGSTGGTALVDSGSYFSGTPVTVLGAGSLTRTGYTFSKWNTQAGGGGTNYSPAATFNIGDANPTLYAQWTVATATLTAEATFPGSVSTTYGTASSATNLAVSGSNLVADLIATAPGNLEISSDNTNFGATVTFTQSGGSASGTLYLRLKNNAPVSGSPYDGQAVVLTSTGASPVSMATTASGNTVTAKVLTLASATAQDKMHDGNTSGSVTGSFLTAEAFDAGSSDDGAPYLGDTLTLSAPGTFSSAAVGGPYTVTPGTFSLGGSSAGNYALTQPTGLTLSASIVNTATWTQVAGGTWNGSANWLNGVIATGADNTADFSTLDLSATATVTLSGPQTIGGLIFADTTPDNNWLVTGSTLTLAASSAPTINVGSQTATISSALAGSGGMVKTGAGILVLTSNTSGAMNLSANHGTLKLAVAGLAYNNAGGGGNSGTLTVNAGAILQIGAGYNIGYQQAVDINGGTLDLSNNFTGDGQNYTLNFTLSNGGSILSSTGSSLRWGELADAVITVNGSAPATISSILRMIPGNGRTGTINVMDADGSLNFTGAIIDFPGIPGGIPLIKTGAGTLTLAGTNTYTSATTVNGGTLQVTGSLSSSAITVHTGAILSGSGSIGGLTTIKSGGTLAPSGTAIATLTLNNLLTLEAGATTSLQIDKTGGILTNDQLAVSAVAYQGTLQLSASGEALLPGDSFTLFNSLTFSGGFASYILPALDAGYSWDVSRLTLDGTVFVTATLPTPTFNLVSGGYIGTQTLTLSDTTAGTTLYYEFTTDGSTPQDPSTSSPHGAAGSSSATLNLPAGSGMAIKTYATKTGSLASPLASAEYFAVITPTWTRDASGTWSDTLNWAHGAVATGAGVNADFSSIALSGNTTVTLDSSHTLGGLSCGDAGNAFGWILNASGGSALTLDNGSSAPVITVANQTTLISAALAGTTGLTKTGPGSLILSGTNTYTGNILLNAGTLVTGSATALPAGGDVAITHATLDVGSSAVQFNWYEYVSSTTVGVGGVLNLNGGATQIHNLTLAGGTLAGSSPQGNFGSWGFNTPTTVEPIMVSGGVTSTLSALKFDSAWANALTFNVDADSTLDVTGSIGGNPGHSAFPLVKTGAGTMRLAGVNPYTGTTTVNAGVLLVNGSIAADSAVTVQTGGTLGGTGSIDGSVTVQAGGSLAPGDGSSATLVTGNVTLAGTYACELNAANADRLAVTGNLDLTGAMLAIATPGGGASASSYVIASYTGSLTGTFASVSGLPAGYTMTYDAVARQIRLAKSGFGAWAALNGLSGDPAADFDHDGLPDAVEYVLGTSPTAANEGGPTGVVANGNLVFSFRRDHAALTPDISIDIETSSNLAVWSGVHHVGADSASSDAGIGVTDQGTYDTITLTTPLNSDPSKFARLRVSVATPH